MQEIRYLDKLVDEFAKGKAMEKICADKYRCKPNGQEFYRWENEQGALE